MTDKPMCPIPGCPEALPRGKLMCLMHWKATPLALRKDVSRTWLAFRRAERGKPALEAALEYRAASDAAKGHVARAQAPVSE